MLLTLSILFIIGLYFGSYINALSHSITFDKSFYKTQFYCDCCNKKKPWFYNIPLISWIILKGKCQNCSSHISILYPFIELISGFLFTILFIKIFIPFASYEPFTLIYDSYLIKEIINNLDIKNVLTFIVYLIPITALIASIRSDLEAMVIPQIFSLWLTPLGIIGSIFSLTNINVMESIIGTILGYGILWSVGKIFLIITKEEGLGVGDMELLSMIGSFFGPKSILVSLLIGSVSGVLIGGFYLLIRKKNKSTKIPFGPFLALGALAYFFFDNYFNELFF